MARRTVIELLDDIDGTTASETIIFAIDGLAYEIDLNETHAAKLRNNLAEWIESARNLAGQRATSPAQSSSASSPAIREWARNNGYEVSARGRISTELMKMWESAQ